MKYLREIKNKHNISQIQQGLSGTLLREAAARASFCKKQNFWLKFSSSVSIHQHTSTLLEMVKDQAHR